MNPITSFIYTVGNEEGITVEKLLREKWQAGKKMIHLIRMAQSVTNESNEPIDWTAPLQTGTKVHVHMPTEASSYLLNEEMSLKVLYEDDHLIAVWKEAGLATHPTSKTEKDTLMNAVFTYISKENGIYAEHIHRLDRETAGIILVAKHPIAKTIFDRMIEKNEITRLYEAELEGNLKRPRGTIHRPIGRDRHHPTRRRVSPTGKQATTHFKIVERKSQSTVVQVQLETGRTHQIRVHFAYLGHPVVGDTLYKGKDTEDGQLRLTATTLSFIHPFTEEEIKIESFR